MPRIAVDAMGGDHAPEQIVLGAIDAAKAGHEPVLVGDVDAIEAVLEDSSIPIVAASEVIEMEDDPARAIREKKDSSISVAARLVADGDADGLVSAGSTGAALAAAAFIIGRIDGVSRPAIASVFPHGEIVLDSGANLSCRSEHLVQFAVMGAALAEVRNQRAPARVGLVNIGEEAGKGRDLEKEAYDALTLLEGIDFVGNIEGRHIAAGIADVLVTDGFTGNVLLKTAEGAARMSYELVASALLNGEVTDIADVLEEARIQLDPEATGGAHLLGTKGVVVIAHGSSSRRAVANAIQMASEGAKQGLAARIATGMAAVGAQ
ncbi:MAG: phosphate acyltransferase PlsX [Acidimicrobiia bacterium]|nr:phosphate acyltransferase PlsX [Acidimicrobiia bacterium]